MKRLFNIFILFFALALSLLLEPSALQAQQVDLTGYIQNVKTETVVLASNSLLDSEIYSNQDEESTNYSSNSPFLVSFAHKDANFSKNKAQLNGCFIHNLSTNKQKVHPIRAP